MRVSWIEFKEYALEFVCPNCKEHKEPSRKHDKCVEVCLKNYINFVQKDDGM